MANESAAPSAQAEQRKVNLFEGAWKQRVYVAKISAAALGFWLLQFLYHYLVFSPGDVALSIVRSFAFAGATMISFALMIGPLARVSKLVFSYHRRAVGVWGFTFIIMHIVAVAAFIFNFDLSLPYSILDPFVNPIIFGSLAFAFFVPMYLTSTDWAFNLLGYFKWKSVHRLVYIAYIFSVLHYTLINPSALQSLSGYLLMLATLAAFGLELFVFLKTVAKSRSMKAIAVGGAIILFALILFAKAFLFK